MLTMYTASPTFWAILSYILNLNISLNKILLLYCSQYSCIFTHILLPMLFILLFLPAILFLYGIIIFLMEKFPFFISEWACWWQILFLSICWEVSCQPYYSSELVPFLFYDFFSLTSIFSSFIMTLLPSPPRTPIIHVLNLVLFHVYYTLLYFISFHLSVLPCGYFSLIDLTIYKSLPCLVCG